ncbi:unnamed protein product [Adineta steineri]|uniref:Uncharacterized protein n=1 Tax=Adineta steineri TaxID=433720 RepID=A0A818R9B9_9BILA|nr:unnamed protein product [Adineta steineri]CAF1164106.1 unnamed protein product [Adineta steineri]CAF1178708.1 unnamed protein product [Adineta steineri]CAF3578202.1 unnamed protein product [Adineta steineri]CAF3653870.1 unnamed protein product [Adineta steineri]
MSMEAQFYEAKRRQRAIERRQSHRNPHEMAKPVRQIHYQPLQPFNLPTRSFHHEDNRMRCTCTPMHMMILDDSVPVSFERSRDIYPRPKTTAGPGANATPRRFYKDPILTSRFSSTEYKQQW